MRLYRISHEIFSPEGDTPDVPVIVHAFQGSSQREARNCFEAHLKTDSFLRAAESVGQWRGEKLLVVKTAGWIESPGG